VGIGRECGISSLFPFWSFRRRNPASILASLEKGGDFTTSLSHTRGLSSGAMIPHFMSYMTYLQPVLTDNCILTENIALFNRHELHFSTGTHRLKMTLWNLVETLSDFDFGMDLLSF
jgi:hypothetical protein